MPADSAPAYLDFVSQAQELRVELNGASACRIGRLDQNTVILADEAVSRYHAVIQRDGFEQYSIADLGSQNGTFVNGHRVTSPVVLRDGSRIDVGNHRLTFRQEAPTPPQQPQYQSTVRSMAVRKVSVLVADIHNSTQLWSLAPKGASQAMAAFNREAGKLLDREDTWSQKFSGDGVMAVWIHDESHQETAELPCRIIRSLLGIADFAAGLEQRFDLPFSLRVSAGIDSGMAILGNFGSAAAADHTALGDAVNRAFRLEAATRGLDCDVSLSDDIHSLWLGFFPALALRAEFLQLKGFPAETLVHAGSFADLRRILEPNNGKTA